MMNIRKCPLSEAALLYSSEPAFSDAGKEYTYGELEQLTEYYQRIFSFVKNEAFMRENGVSGLLSAGLDGTDLGEYLFTDALFPKVIIKATPSVDHVAAIFAMMRNGITYIPFSSRETPERIRTVARDARAFIINDLRRFAESVNAMEAFRNEEFHLNDHVDPYAPCNMMMTSGSTAMPKLVVHNLNAHLKSALGGQKVLDIRRGDRYLLSLPLNHVGGQAVIFKCVLTGAVMVSPRKDMSPAGQILQDRITVLSLVPTQLVRIMENNPEVLAESCVRAILLGGAPIDEMLIARMHDLYPSIALYGSYGSTEMASQICTNVLLKGKEITAGFPLPYRELVLNSDGEILVRGETLCMGYFRNGLIEKVTGDDGYFHTGDIGRMLPSGLTVSGRRDNMFISGGENIHPEQVEAMLLKNQNIAEVLVVPVRDHEWGMMAVALVRTAPEFNGTLEDLRQQALSEMSHVYVPKIWLNMPEIENTGLKIRRGKYIEFAEKALNRR